MKYAVLILEKEMEIIERTVRDKSLMQVDMRKATQELSKVTEIKRAIKFLKNKEKAAIRGVIQK